MNLLSIFAGYRPSLVWLFILIASLLLGGCSAKPQTERQGREVDEDAVAEQPVVPGASQGIVEMPPSEPSLSADRRATTTQSASAPDREAAPSIAYSKSPEITNQSRTRSSMPPDMAPSMSLQPMNAPSAVRSLSTDTPLAPQSVTPETSAVEPAGTTRNADEAFATVEVYYATDRQRGKLPLSALHVSGDRQTLFTLIGCTACLWLVSLLCWARARSGLAALLVVGGCATGVFSGVLVLHGQAPIEKHGVTYTADRGTLARGICKVTVPNSHQRGVVERPSLLRLEFREDQEKHVVLSSAVELSENDFQQRLSQSVAGSPDRDLLVFIHGYNVDFQSAVRRTAQVAVDLPFEGVPVCYSWPSQASLLGYTIDKNNADWTVSHLKTFLLELAETSGAQSINVVAHSMGNRAMTAAMQQIELEHDPQSPAPFDRIVLAAPDVDADQFRRDFGPSLVKIANQVTLYASSDDQALVASKLVHGSARAGDSGGELVIVPGIETIDVSGIDLSLLGHSYYGDNESMLRDLYDVVRQGLPARQRASLIARGESPLIYWQLAQRPQTLLPATTR